jgi:hypothetical protein
VAAVGEEEEARVAGLAVGVVLRRGRNSLSVPSIRCRGGYLGCFAVQRRRKRRE